MLYTEVNCEITFELSVIQKPKLFVSVGALDVGSLVKGSGIRLVVLSQVHETLVVILLWSMVYSMGVLHS